MENRMYLLKIELLHTEPNIWRRFVVPAEITLDRLHDVIQIVMGWQDMHLYSFTIGTKRYTVDPRYKDDGLDCQGYRLGNLIKQKGRTFLYEYDFGDDWRHEITLEESRYHSDEILHGITCIDGENACPPEDVGGIPGFERFCRIVADPGHPEREGYLQWYGGVFNRNGFNLELAIYDLIRYQRWSRDRLLPWRP
jgi:hypothetical protein